MARIRTIKPDFWTDEKLTECSMSARLFFIGMWNFADDNGNLTRSAKKMKMQIFPAESCDCEELIQELMAIGVLVEYEVDGDKYMHIKGFTKHQVINRPSKSSIPEPELNDGSLSAHGVLKHGREGKGKEEEGKGIEPAAKPSATKKSKTALPNGFALSARVIAWANEKGHTNLDTHLENFISAAKRNGYTYVDWDEALMEAIRKDWAKLSQAKGLPTDLDSINARNNAEAKRLLFGTPSDVRTINA